MPRHSQHAQQDGRLGVNQWHLVCHGVRRATRVWRQPLSSHPHGCRGGGDGADGGGLVAGATGGDGGIEGGIGGVGGGGGSGWQGVHAQQL